MKNWKTGVLILIWCFITLLLGAQVRFRSGIENEPIVCITGFGIMIISSLLAYQFIKQPAAKTCLYFIASFFFLDLTVRFIEGFSDSYFSLFRLIYFPLGITAGYLLYNKRWKPVMLITAIMLIATFFFQTRYIKPYVHYLNFHTSTGLVNRPEPALWNMYTTAGGTISDNELKGKTIILDFWYTSCGVCFRKFPVLQQLYDSLGHRKDLAFYAVNIPWRRDTPGMAMELIKERGYTFPVAMGSQPLASSFGVETYPTLVVVKDQRVVFFGDIDLFKERLPDILR